MDNKMIKECDLFARQLLEQAGQIIIDKIDKKLTVDTKANRSDLVTNMDIGIQHFIYESLLEKYPHHRFLGEEEGKGTLSDTKGCIWILDPIDGTQNFVCLRRDFAISLALYIDNVGTLGYVYDVMRGELTAAVHGEGVTLNGKPVEPISAKSTFDNSLLVTEINTFNKFAFVRECCDEAISVRMLGCAALETLSVLTGRAAAYLNGAGIKVWDIAGAAVIAQELGVMMTRFDGTKLNILEAPVTLIVARPEVHRHIFNKYLANSK